MLCEQSSAEREGFQPNTVGVLPASVLDVRGQDRLKGPGICFLRFYLDLDLAVSLTLPVFLAYLPAPFTYLPS